MAPTATTLASTLSLSLLSSLLLLTPTTLAANFTTYTDRTCTTVSTFTQGFAPALLGNGSTPGCYTLPPNIQSLSADYNDFRSAYANTRFYTSCDCSGLGVGQSGTAGYGGPQFPVGAGDCLAATVGEGEGGAPDSGKGTWGSFYFETYR